MVMLRMPHYYGWDRMKELVIFVFNINKIDTESYGFLQDIGNYKFYNTYECTILLICFYGRNHRVIVSLISNEPRNSLELSV